LSGIGKWIGLKQLRFVGARLPISGPNSILGRVAKYEPIETMYTLARIGGDLANGEGGFLGKEAMSWTYDLLASRPNSTDELEARISRSMIGLPRTSAVAHGHVLSLLQLLVLTRGNPAGRIASDGELAFLMLALNDHIPEWEREAAESLEPLHEHLATLLCARVFGRSFDDPMRFLVRLVAIFGGDVVDGPISAEEWRAIQEEAFGCPFEEYARAFLGPIFTLSQGWCGSGKSEDAPIVFRVQWEGSGRRARYKRWLDEASIPSGEVARAFEGPTLPSGLPKIPALFFRTPFVDVGGKLVALAPWHFWDHVRLGTWGKLNMAAKKVLRTDSAQKFTSLFGYLFERWCALVARNAAQSAVFRERLIIPVKPGVREIEDIVVLDAQTVALFSVKSGLVPEGQVKVTDDPSKAYRWLEKFFFEPVTESRSRGFRGGVLRQLDKKIEAIRRGEFIDRGIAADVTILPVVVVFDSVCESGPLYVWLHEQCERMGLISARDGVRPVTVLDPEDFEGLFALAASGLGVCALLLERTEGEAFLEPVGHFLHRKTNGVPAKLRPAFIQERFDELVAASLETVKEIEAEHKAWTSSTGGSQPVDDHPQRL
jgi:hypothetical protein